MGTATLFFTLTTLVTLCGCDHAFLEEPKEFRSSHGVLNVTLNVEAGQVSGGPFTFVSRLVMEQSQTSQRSRPSV
eukprot:m.70786 g.70786  ORF g.70786 m.70786 type:complete len:75 (-) comp14096_c0_seq3:267-491(-)